MGSDESPFTEVPASDAGPRPTPLTYESQVANVGAFAVGLQNRSPRLRFAVRAVAVLFGGLLLVAIIWGLFGG